MQKKIEILAPAGGMESLVAGVRSGASAVYLGGKLLNARRNAGNFDNEELEKACRYCHSNGVKVYYTLNTLMLDDEIETALDAVKQALLCGVDAFIIQDFGFAQLVKKYFPDAEIHASTQMSVTSPDGFKQLKQLGFSRAVTPREMTLKEIEDVHACSDIEIESFVHGALCMCVSGQCYMSALLGSRSGNRGLCAQPCRLPFSVKNGGCNLSLKDMSLVEEMDKMANAGVYSFKIEGRMKRPEYVAAAVDACLSSQNDSLDSEKMRTLESVFSRSGFTKGYLEGKLGAHMFGIRRKEDVVAAKDVLGKLASLYRTEMQRIPVKMEIQMSENKKAQLRMILLDVKDLSVFCQSDEDVQKAINRSLTQDEIRQRFSKLGGTPFYAKEIDVQLDDGVMMSASSINALRRKAVEQAMDKLAENPNDIEKVRSAEYSLDRKTSFRMKKQVRARFDSFSQIPNNADKLDLVFLHARESVENFEKALSKCKKTGVELPRAIFSNTEIIFEKLLKLKSLGINDALCGSLDAVLIAKRAGMRVHGDFGLNVFNTYSLNFYSSFGIESQTLSFELKLDHIARMGGDAPRGIIAYGRYPLMLTRNCPVKNEIGCEKCGRSSSIVDRKGISFPVRCAYGFSEIYNSRPVVMSDRLDEIKNVDFITLYFTTESAEQCAQVIDAYMLKKAAFGEYTRGLYYRGVE